MVTKLTTDINSKHINTCMSSHVEHLRLTWKK